ncbi:MAG: response regulator [Syntrophobacteraceae bacterium]|nr:response regulator [Syntrophobacteraceae bacterium]
MEKIIEKIFIVDDEQDICAMLTKFLRSSGYCCDSSTDPARALGILKKDSFDLVISDIKMAGMDGMQLLSQLHEITPQIDIIMMTGHTNTYTYSDIIRAGAADFMGKPFRLAEILAKIERIERERKMQKELRELNIAMAVLLQRAGKDKDNLQADIAANVKESILPYVDKLKNGRFDKEHQEYVAILQKNLLEVFSPFLRNLSLKNTRISSMEAQVANFVKSGKSNKEIASLIGISLNTVMTHRYRLRSKLGLNQKKVNLRSYLNSIE